MRTLGKNMAWLMKLVEHGKGAATPGAGKQNLDEFHPLKQLQFFFSLLSLMPLLKKEFLYAIATRYIVRISAIYPILSNFENFDGVHQLISNG